MNVVIVQGRLMRPVEQRVLASGEVITGLEISVQGATGRESVNVAWPDAPATAVNLDPGVEVVVVGRVRRRFFRAGGATQSRTEVVADTVVPANRVKRVEALLETAIARIEDGEPVATG